MSLSLITITHKLREVYKRIGNISLQPQIAIVGTEKSGKTSVLETLIAQDFLPKCKTRCPVILELINTKDFSSHHIENKTAQEDEWGKFLHTGKKIYKDSQAILTGNQK